MIRVGICDDEAAARDSLRLQLEKTDMFDRGDAQVVYEFSSGEGMVSWLSRHGGELDIIFLDVEMKELNGIEAAHRLREFDRSVMLVFLTGYSDFVFEGYKVDALDYMIKPASLDDVMRVMERAVKRLGETDRAVLLKNADGTFRIYKEEILYCQSRGRQTEVVLAGGRTLSFYKKLDEMEESLGKGFVRIHQRYLVNGGRVMQIGRESVTLEGDIVLPVSRSLRERATSSLVKYMIGD